MLALLIKLPKIGIDYKFDGDKMYPEIHDKGHIWVNAEQIRYIEVLDADTTPWTRIDLGGDSLFAYTSLTPEQVVETIDAARKKTA